MVFLRCSIDLLSFPPSRLAFRRLAAGQLLRDYAVLVHGQLSSRLVATPLRVPPNGLGPTSCGRGKPAASGLRAVAVLLAGHRVLQVLTVRIGSGRRHQIRAHTAYCGHPTVRDGA